MSTRGCWTPIGLFAAYWLFSQTNTMGSFQTEAMFSDSWNSPSAAAPSPKKHTRSRRPCPRAGRRERRAARRWAALRPRCRWRPSMPTEKSAMCMEPPLPLQYPSTRPNSSAIIRRTSAPLAMQWPCPRCVLVTRIRHRQATRRHDRHGLLAHVGMHRAVDLAGERSWMARSSNSRIKDHGAQHLHELRLVERHAVPPDHSPMPDPIRRAACGQDIARASMTPVRGVSSSAGRSRP